MYKYKVWLFVTFRMPIGYEGNEFRAFYRKAEIPIQPYPGLIVDISLAANEVIDRVKVSPFADNGIRVWLKTINLAEPHQPGADYQLKLCEEQEEWVEQEPE